MNIPIRDFVKDYAEKDVVRLHMPGHKGKSFLGFEKYDITEIDSADVLYSANGIIKESEENASRLFGTYKTFYSAEGSSLCIKAMLAMVVSSRGSKAAMPKILAARNVHKAFVYACGLLDIDVDWLIGESNHICSCNITAEDIKNKLVNYDVLPSAVYITSPDYLGNIIDIRSVADVCDEFEIPLLVDNAHGAYLHFLETKQHPIDLGAYMCCDSAHKTLPVLTGGAYLHLSQKAKAVAGSAENMLSLFASTSPSYLILQSLDVCNAYLSENYSQKLKATVLKLDRLKSELANKNFSVLKSEPLKLVIDAEASGLSASDIFCCLKKHNIEVEYYDSRVIVMMFTCENGENDFKMLSEALFTLNPIPECSESQKTHLPEIGKKMISIRNAVFASKETVSTSESVGRICACPTVSCPPAVPIVISGEIIDKSTAELMLSYGINEIEVVKN